MELEDLILTNKQYRDHPFAKNPNNGRSYVFHYKNKDKEILFFGTAHTNKPEDPLFIDIEKKFKEIKPDIVYVEGWESLNTKRDYVYEVIKNKSINELKLKGEPHFILKLAIDADIDFESPEPSFRKEIDYLVDNGFTKEDIFTYFIYRTIDQYQRHFKERSISECKKYLIPYIKEFEEYSGWKLIEIKNFEENVIASLDLENEEKYNSQVNPIPWENKEITKINQIASTNSSFRDRYIFKRISEGLKKYNKLFVLYGSGHAVKLEPAIKKLMNS
ncbi:MAG: hypothetical protein V4504_00315 [Patescibacteria group bacterium]